MLVRAGHLVQHLYECQKSWMENYFYNSTTGIFIQLVYYKNGVKI